MRPGLRWAARRRAHAAASNVETSVWSASRVGGAVRRPTPPPRAAPPAPPPAAARGPAAGGGNGGAGLRLAPRAGLEAGRAVRLGSSGRGEPAGKNLPEGDLGGIGVVEPREVGDWCLD